MDLSFPVSREALFLRCDSGTFKRAFAVQLEGYDGSVLTKPAQYATSIYDGRLLATYGARQEYRAFVGVLIISDSYDGLVVNDGHEDILYGTAGDLKTLAFSTDLEAYSLEDVEYWPAEWSGDYRVIVNFDPMGAWLSAPCTLMQRTSV